jgi:hypothetical protein
MRRLQPFFLSLFVSWFAPVASADNASMSCAGPTLSDGAFLASWCSNNLFIAGPNGVEDLKLGFVPDVQRSFFLNSSGEVVGSLEALGDRSSYFLVYTGAVTIFMATLGSSASPAGGGRGFLPGTEVNGDFGTFNSDPGPVFQDPREPGGVEAPVLNGLSPSVLITGLSDQGVVTGVESYGYDFHPDVNLPVTWVITPEPSAWMLVLGAALLTLVIKWKTLFH